MLELKNVALNYYSKNGETMALKDISFNIKPTPNGWYLAGNFIFGGLLGWLIVDPATGAMWNLKPHHTSIATT